MSEWRKAHGYPFGANPYAGGHASRPMGSRIALDLARESGANFGSESVLSAVRKRLANPEKHQMLKEDRLWADLLSSMPMCFNLFGGLDGDPEAAARAIRAWWPASPVGAVRVRFEHSPGRRDPLFLGNRSAFDVAFEMEPVEGPGASGIVGVETKYHEHAKAEAPPAAAALSRYAEVTERSGAFAEGWRERLVGTDLQQIWLDHLLVLSMLQHPSRRWSWGKFVLVHPAENPSMASAGKRYREALRDGSSFEARTIESLLETPDALNASHVNAFRERYLSDEVQPNLEG